MITASNSWGKIAIVRDPLGYLEVSIENERLAVRYGHGLRFHRGVDMHESYVIEFVNRETREDQVQYHKNGFGWGCLDAGEWHGLIDWAGVTHCDEERLTARMVWNPIQGEAAVKEVSLFRGQPWLKIDYLRWCVNIFDIGVPGGTTLGEYSIYGMENWKRPITLYPDIYFDRSPVDIGYQNITELDEAGPLDYRGWFVMGVHNPDNGYGFGRIAPVESTDIVKLLFQDEAIGRRGFELFPYYEREHRLYTSYLFPYSDGKSGLQLTAQTILDWLGQE